MFFKKYPNWSFVLNLSYGVKYCLCGKDKLLCECEVLSDVDWEISLVKN